VTIAFGDADAGPPFRKAIVGPRDDEPFFFRECVFTLGVLLSVSVPSFTNLDGIKMAAAFVVKPEAFTQRVFHEKELPLKTR
jgi:hypothetical protein